LEENLEIGEPAKVAGVKAALEGCEIDWISGGELDVVTWTVGGGEKANGEIYDEVDMEGMELGAERQG
jgi:hypothetical protein